ncbi:MAG: hypothetical protein IJJ85_11880 [Clostridia bacterium]|nr:hypothetical protein [Clostridia bacterium]
MNREIRISDVTMRQLETTADFSLSFREKIELAKLLDKLGVWVIELEGIRQTKADSLRVKSIASAVKDSEVAVPVALTRESVETAWNALKDAKAPRLQVAAAVSPVQMEYIYHKKPDAMLQAIRDTVAACREKTENVEFIAEDATRSDEAFLYAAIGAAVEAGASTVTLCDAAGAILPDEFTAFLQKTRAGAPALSGVKLAVKCADDLSMADACSIAAAGAGADEIKAAAYPVGSANLKNVARVIAQRGESFGAETRVRTVAMGRTVRQIEWLCRNNGSAQGKGYMDADGTGELILSVHDDAEAVAAAAAKLGYDLSEEDCAAVYEAFCRFAQGKEKIDARELNVIVATAAMQVPPTYTVRQYLVSAGNLTHAMATVELNKGDATIRGLAPGDGPIDAAFRAVENATGCRYELDDFQVRAVTEGQEALGECVVRLSADGKLYSGRGISTDVVEAAVHAYLNAINKIVYEEAEA